MNITLESHVATVLAFITQPKNTLELATRALHAIATVLGLGMQPKNTIVLASRVVGTAITVSSTSRTRITLSLARRVTGTTLLIDGRPKNTIELSIRAFATTLTVSDALQITLVLEVTSQTRIIMSHLDTYDVGDVAEISIAVRRRLTGALINPGTLVVRTLKPDGSIVTMTYDNDVTEHGLVRDPGAVDRPLGLTPAGAFFAYVDCNLAGAYLVEVKTTGEGQAMEPTTFTVRASRIPLA